MKNFTQLIIALLLPLLCPLGANAQDSGDLHWLAERAATSDVVVVAQLERTDYDYQRDFPVGGETWFRALFGYKGGDDLGLIIVPEQGLGNPGCYFPESLAELERPRYLLFLVRGEEGELRGHPEGCALEVLVSSDNRYAVRWPQPRFGDDAGLDDPVLRELARPLRFQGPLARIDASELLTHQRRDRAERMFMRVDGSDLLPTRGIPLGELRGLMRPGLLDPDDEAAVSSRRMDELRQRMGLSDEEPAGGEEG
ncbi:MAG: hypothetical protein R3323_00250 [Wenzhouxiangellaceae bacterium]|nr:hypothetical protein [Wenzhouxiangellaceae bacterium]